MNHYLAVVVLMCADAFTLSCALLIAFLLRFDSHNFLTTVYPWFLHPNIPHLWFGLIIYLASFSLCRLYRHAWRFASLETVWGVIYANTVGLVGLIVSQSLFTQTPRMFPTSIYTMFWLFSIVLVGGMRILLRLAHLSLARRQLPGALQGADVAPHRVVILGGGPDGARLLAALREDLGRSYTVIGFLDDAPEKHGVYIRGVPILGHIADLDRLLDTREVDEVFIATPETCSDCIHNAVMACRHKKIPVKIIPGLHDTLSGKTRARLEDISVEDLLRRPPVQIDLQGIGAYVAGKRVLVTGAGGSIGGELCRQIITQRPSALILLGHGENSIHTIYQELSSNYPTLAHRLHIVIASVANLTRIDQIFREYQPQVVFHAAAHKHVPIMEENVSEAVRNNVLGTDCVAKACGRNGVDTMTLISTDKAVYPSSVMGATKWLCEQAVRATAATYPDTRYLTVRFGNVLGSRGSVVPIFREQIRRGGPVTVTHPEMTRYFMTIPEAVQLVLQAGVIGQSDELFLLDMGKPVRIVDLARDMIRLSGLEPEVDIPIVFTGMRSGEKLHEQLAVDDANIVPAACERLFIVHRPVVLSTFTCNELLQQLELLIVRGDEQALLAKMDAVVPSFAERSTHIAPLVTTEHRVAAHHG